MISLYLELNGKNISVNTVNGQKNLQRITVDGMFSGYFDTTGKDTNYSDSLSHAEVKFIESEILNAIK